MLENLRKIQDDPCYYIDNRGNVYNSDLKVLKQDSSRDGIPCICFKRYINKKREFLNKTHVIARLVLEHFVRKANHNEIAVNIDGNKLNNNVSNLAWKTINNNNRFNPNNNPNYHKGENHPQAILTKKDVLDIKKKLAEGILLQREIAKEYNIAQTTVSGIKRGTTWTHLK